jgi:mannan endo-1,4-beta-mannosidase
MTPPRVRLTAAVLACMTLAFLLAACGPASHAASGGNGAAPGRPQAQTTPKAAPINMNLLINPTAGKYFGVEPDAAVGALGAVRDFADVAGRKPDLVGYYVGWHTPFAAAAAQTTWSYGALYYMAWEPFGTTVADIAAGDSNRYISEFAQAVKAANVPIAISFGHEMNGNWYPWGSTDASPASFVAAWRLIHALFVGAGATNVIWIWNPNVISASPVPLQPYYPGNSYVDWIGLTGYFPMTGATTFTELFGPTMTEIRQFTGKPFIIVETAVQSGPEEVTCTRNLVRGVLHRSDVLGLVWFEYDKGGVDWTLADRPPVRTTVAQEIAKLNIVDVRRA